MDKTLYPIFAICRHLSCCQSWRALNWLNNTKQLFFTCCTTICCHKFNCFPYYLFFARLLYYLGSRGCGTVFVKLAGLAIYSWIFLNVVGIKFCKTICSNKQKLQPVQFRTVHHLKPGDKSFNFLSFNNFMRPLLKSPELDWQARIYSMIL